MSSDYGRQHRGEAYDVTRRDLGRGLELCFVIQCRRARAGPVGAIRRTSSRRERELFASVSGAGIGHPETQTHEISFGSPGEMPWKPSVQGEWLMGKARVTHKVLSSKSGDEHVLVAIHHSNNDRIQVLGVFFDQRRAQAYAVAEDSLCASHEDLLYGRLDARDAHEGRAPAPPVSSGRTKTILEIAMTIARNAALPLLWGDGQSMVKIGRALGLTRSGARSALIALGFDTGTRRTEEERERREKFADLWNAGKAAIEIARVMNMRGGAHSVYNRVRELGLNPRDPVGADGARRGQTVMTRAPRTPPDPIAAPEPHPASRLLPPIPAALSVYHGSEPRVTDDQVRARLNWDIDAAPLPPGMQRRCECLKVFEPKTVAEVLCPTCARSGRRASPLPAFAGGVSSIFNGD